ncbi:MAG: hypothetical protein IKT38_01520 [Clostridia bacterium]|nr:hypothetical protein [Clostridia bacterium]
MDKKFEASIEIFYFEQDIITTSGDHDNGYVDDGDLAFLRDDTGNNI